jgi:hypothetical protein
MSTPEALGSLVSPMPGATVPVINQATEPASVRNGTPQVKEDYEKALSFESVLVNELTEQLVQTAGIGSGSTDSSSSSSSGTGAAGSDPTVSDFASLLPGALTSAIMNDGGLGLAAQLMPSIDGSASPSSQAAGTQGGTTAS